MPNCSHATAKKKKTTQDVPLVQMHSGCSSCADVLRMQPLCRCTQDAALVQMRSVFHNRLPLLVFCFLLWHLQYGNSPIYGHMSADNSSKQLGSGVGVVDIYQRPDWVITANREYTLLGGGEGNDNILISLHIFLYFFFLSQYKSLPVFCFEGTEKKTLINVVTFLFPWCLAVTSHATLAFTHVWYNTQKYCPCSTWCTAVMQCYIAVAGVSSSSLQSLITPK